MADTTSLEMPQGGGGHTNWLLIIGSLAGVAGLFLLLKNQGGGGTTAAGTSINAALGSIEEENMNLLGTTQAGFQGASTQLSQTGATLAANQNQGFQDLSGMISGDVTGLQQQIGGVSGQITSTQGLISALQSDIDNQLAGISSQLTGFSSQTNTNFANLMGVVQSGQASQNQVNGQITTLLQSIQQDVNSGLVSQQQANDLLNSIQTFQIWEFYQIPNRYSAQVPAPYQSAGVGTH